VNHTLIVHTGQAAAELHHNDIADLQSVVAGRLELVVPELTTEVDSEALDIQQDQKPVVALELPVPIPLVLCPNQRRGLALPYTHMPAEGKKCKEVPCRHANQHEHVSAKSQIPAWFVTQMKDVNRLPTISKS